MLDFTTLKNLYELDKKANDCALNEYLEAKKYYHGEQLPPEVKSIILNRGQAPIIENIFKLIINKIIGYKAQSISEIKVSGRQEMDTPLANVLNDLLKYFSQNRNYNREMTARDKNLIFGLAVIELWIQQDENKDFDLQFKSLEPESFLIDCYSKDLNALDARRFHKKINMSLNEAKQILDVTPFKNAGGTNEDERCVIIESWIKDENGLFHRYIWQEAGLLKSELSPFKNGAHPFIISKYQIDDKGLWYGLFRDIKPLQDYVNFAENRMANMMGSLKAFFEEDAVLNAEEFINEASLDNAIVKVRSGALKENKFQFIQHHNDIATLSQKANEKRQLAKMLSGLNEEALGLANNRLSAAAVSQRKETGLMGLQEYLNACEHMDRLIFEKVIFFITHYFTKEQVFKITDEKTGERYFSINSSEDNKIKVGKFDLIYKSQLKTTGREERFAYWSEMFKTISSVRPDLISDILPLMLKDTDSPVAADIENILKEKEAMMQEQANEPNEMQNLLNELQIAKLQAEIAELQAKAKKYASQGDLADSVTLAQSLELQEQALNPEQTSHNKSMQKGGIDLR
ncbi:hypothetical protein [Campylobacter cuniculorum]|uniref:Portal protein n=2 Tax=Campylobacter cuniculorum TaxID=374106 RepID=A0A1W6BV21_9BACT|nr:hypothetical protein [Campylobacter cuniculorum]ARJ55932.1 hypothetical protein CCUN_0277 [Campylobacter cuniculorum DSM 23162 = LMG 24588]QOR05151.1 portal protein [Campylobacter cuniculorum]